MKGSTENPKVFISYAWGSTEKDVWVIELAKKLQADGVQVVLDKWDLKGGNDTHAFMEKMVHDETITKVLVICDKAYSEKANERVGGVGTETQLISKKVYEDVGQDKFIPVIREADEEGKPYLPHYIATRIHYNLSSEDRYAEQYELLLRQLYNQPLHRRPPLGSPPPYIGEQAPVRIEVAGSVSEIKNALMTGSSGAHGLVRAYLENFLRDLQKFKIPDDLGEVEKDDEIVRKIDEMLVLRDDFVDFITAVFTYQKDVDLELFHDFLEKLMALTYSSEEKSERYSREGDFDHVRFIAYEIVLYYMAVLTRLKCYAAIGQFVSAEYMHRDLYAGDMHSDSADALNRYAGTLDEARNRRLELNRVSVTADLIRDRANRDDVKFSELQESDLLIYFLTLIHDFNHPWFPRTAVLRSFGHTNIEVFKRLLSKKQFDRIKVIFGVESIDELREKIKAIPDDKSYSGRRFEHNIPDLNEVLKLDETAALQ